MNNQNFAQYAQIKLPFSISTSWLFNNHILAILFLIFTVLYCIVTSVLWYHWNTYGMNSYGIKVGRMLFMIVSMILFGTALLGLIYF